MVAGEEGARLTQAGTEPLSSHDRGIGPRVSAVAQAPVAASRIHPSLAAALDRRRGRVYNRVPACHSAPMGSGLERMLRAVRADLVRDDHLEDYVL